MMANSIYSGAETYVRQEMNSRSTHGRISCFQLKKILVSDGGMHEQDA